MHRKRLISIRILPIGLNAQIDMQSGENTNWFIINVSGPLINILLFAVFFILDSYYLNLSDNMRFFIYVNAYLAIFNMLPMMPLDGGRILRGVLYTRLGLFKAHKYTKRVSKFLGILLIIVGMYRCTQSVYNFSIILIGGYIFYFLKYEDMEVSFMNIKNIVYRRSRFLKKGVYPGRELVVIKSMRLGDIVKNMDFDRFHIIYVLDDNMKLAKVFTEQEIIDNMIKYNAEMSFDELLQQLA